jgi:Tfp pilus tip-associated adhesin PilY1
MGNHNALRSPAAALAVGATLCIVLGLALSSPGHTDDRDLLRFSSSKPYLFILLDTSSSMNLAIGAGDKPVLGGGDNPNSRIYAAKQALYNVFVNVDDVNFGFANFNQDRAHVVAKHLVYYNPNPLPAAASWPIAFPAQDANGITQFVDKLNLAGRDTDPPIGVLDDVDGLADTVVLDQQGDALTFGPMFDQNGNGNIEANETTPPGNSCLSPLPLGSLGDVDRLRLESFPLANTASNLKIATLWISTTSPARKWRLQVGVPALKADGSTPNAALGEDNLTVKFVLHQVTSCGPPETFGPPFEYQPNMRLDSRFNQTVMVDGIPAGAGGGGNSPNEAIPNLWPSFSDALASAACDSAKPFSGKGWEGNYDSLDLPPAGTADGTPPSDSALATGFPKDDDRFCFNPNNPSTCIEIKPMRHTTYSNLGRPIDSGDVLPFDWSNPQKTQFLQRLAPNYAVDTPVDFGVGSFLRDSASVPGLLEPRLSSRAPIMAVGNTPLGKAILDFRCWYLGTNGQSGNKCSAAAASAAGWAEVACTYDAEYGCRRPYLILISDGDDNCPGENPAADTAAMNSHSGIKTWAINLGDPKNCQAGSPLKSTTQNGKGECVNVSNPEQLLTTIQDILGRIREEARTFASAAVPSVQAIAKQALYLTDFTPLNNNSRWPGHVNAFLKPLPTLNGKPDTSKKCSATITEGCFVWDAGEVLVKTQTQRNVFYTQQSKPGLWVPNRTVLAPTTPGVTPDSQRYDLWRAFGLIAPDTVTGSLTTAQETIAETEANEVINITLAPEDRVGTCDPTKELCRYKLGDIFHSDPLVFGSFIQTTYQRIDAGSQFNQGTVSCSANGETDGSGGDNANFDRGYRCFLARQAVRRQIVYVGSNDGMLHAFNAGQFRDATGRYDNGTGHELFAFMPRSVMKTVDVVAEGSVHHFTVDGPIHAGDVFIDPVDDGDGAAFPVPAERRWRTVAVAGLREGGRGYYALDVTQPDKVTGTAGGPRALGDEAKPGGPYKPDYATEGANRLPSCINNYTENECGPVPYGSALWEFTDNTDNQVFPTGVAAPTLPYAMDEDGNSLPDLAYSWSQPDFARVQICGKSGAGAKCTITDDPDSATDIEERYVVFFGGGLDVAHKGYDPRTAAATDPDGPGPRPSTYDIQGNWIYMVDVETGAVLYKRQLCSPYRSNAAGNPGNPCVPAGSVPSAMAVVDTDLNGYVDRLYVGSTGGYMFRVDLQVFTDDGSGTKKEIVVPALEDLTTNALDGNGNPTAVTIKRIPETDSTGNPLWVPKVIFDANHDLNADALLPRPMYFAPAVLIYQDAGGYALAFGTGDREDLWNRTAQPGRFYLFIDDTDEASQGAPALVCPSLNAGAICPRTENDFKTIALTDGAVRDNFLLSRPKGSRGWYLVLNANQRVITDTFSFSGLTFFSIYQPQVALTDSDGNPLSNTGGCGDKKYESNTTASCAKTGVSSLFLIATTNANGLLPGGLRTKDVSSFVTNPFTQLSTGNTGNGGSGGPVPTPAPIPPGVFELFPKTCHFGNARIDIATIAADTSLQSLGSVPVCLTGHSWKEF